MVASHKVLRCGQPQWVATLRTQGSVSQEVGEGQEGVVSFSPLACSQWLCLLCLCAEQPGFSKL